MHNSKEVKEIVERAWVEAQTARDAKRVALLNEARRYGEAARAATEAHQHLKGTLARGPNAAEYARCLARRDEHDSAVVFHAGALLAAAVQYEDAEKRLDDERAEYVRVVGTEPSGDSCQRYIDELRASNGLRR